MRADFEIKDPKKVEATLSITATVGEFMEILNQINAARGHGNHDYPLCLFTSSIADVIYDAQKHFYKYADSNDARTK